MDVVIGICTGRCGSQSLAKIMSKQNKTLAFHEMYWSAKGTAFREKYPILSIKDKSSCDLYIKSIDFFISKYKDHVNTFFDIGPYTKNSINAINNKYKNVKFIILKRDFANFKKSFVKKKVQMGTLGNKKVIPFDSPKEYYDYIYDKEIMNLENSFLLETKELNNKEKIEDLLNFLEYELPIISMYNEDLLRDK